MKKDIEWLKKEIGTEMIELEPYRADKLRDERYKTLRSVAQKLNQLDEPEVLSQEWVDNNSVNASHDGMTEEYIHVVDLKNLIVPKQDLPVIPKYVADWIEKYTEYGYDLYSALQRMENHSMVWDKTYEWYRTNTHDFVNAYLTGEYEVEEEPLYYAFDKVDDSMLIRKPHSPHGNFLTEMTKSEWNKLGVNDSNADFIRVDK